MPGLPYPHMPQPMQEQNSAARSGQSPPRPPVPPTGFVQGERGAIFAVYQPEDLSKYMGGAIPVQGQQPPHPPPGTQMGPPGWQPYPYAYGYPPMQHPPTLNVSPPIQQKDIHAEPLGQASTGQWQAATQPPTSASFTATVSQALIPQFPPGLSPPNVSMNTLAAQQPAAGYHVPVPPSQIQHRAAPPQQTHANSMASETTPNKARGQPHRLTPRRDHASFSRGGRSPSSGPRTGPHHNRHYAAPSSGSSVDQTGTAHQNMHNQTLASPISAKRFTFEPGSGPSPHWMGERP